ncbi:F-box protein At5g52880 [Curcuma longa]|uniref:F-box protein At5g52880 n=1 Tax=Curcuma longa TaxID=136217 RepID=UPI003D9EA7B7
MGGATVGKRYEELGLAEAISRPHDYSAACHELALILRLAYAHLPKNLQSVVFQDTLSAFRFLPEVQTGYGISSANALLQAAEAALPKQKKALAVSEFKHAAVAYKRRSKSQQDEGSINLPHDVLVHIFSFLDVRSLVSASLVCWPWNSAATDNGLWYMLYSNLFDCHNMVPDEEQDNKLVHENEDGHARTNPVINVDWLKAFRRRCKGGLSWKLLPTRVICGHCQSMIWLSSISCRAEHKCLKNGNQKLNLRPMLPNKIVDYLLGNIELEASSDSDDSDSEDLSQLHKLWAYPRFAGSN